MLHQTHHPLRLEELNLTCFRLFQTLKIPISPDLLVLVGVNGAGKTAVLEAIAISLQALISKLVTEVRSQQHTLAFRDDDITLSVASSRIALKGNIFEVHLTRNRFQEPDITFQGDRGDHIVKHLFSSEKPPVLAYYPVHRAFLSASVPEKLFQPTTPRREGYQDVFVDHILDYKAFCHWFKGYEDFENEKRLRGNPDYRHPSLEVVRQAIAAFFKVFPDLHFGDLRYERGYGDEFTPPDPSGPSLVIQKNENTLRLDQLASGEKNLLMLVADIARRLAILDPHSRPETVLRGNGVILIDEVDLHLHPQWQRIVIKGLQKTFPGCQFLVTTHSPQVLGLVPRENVALLKDGALVEKTPFTKGRDHNTILYELMGVSDRDDDTRNQLDTCFHLIDEGKIPEARREIARLTGFLGEDDPDIVKANTLIDFFHHNE